MEYTFTTPKYSQEELKKLWEQAKPATEEIKQEHETPTGEKISSYLSMTESLQNNLTFWASQKLPAIPETFTPNSETSSTPRSKLDDSIDE